MCLPQGGIAEAAERPEGKFQSGLLGDVGAQAGRPLNLQSERDPIRMGKPKQKNTRTKNCDRKGIDWNEKTSGEKCEWV